MLFSEEGAISTQNEKRMDYLIIVNTCPNTPSLPLYVAVISASLQMSANYFFLLITSASALVRRHKTSSQPSFSIWKVFRTCIRRGRVATCAQAGAKPANGIQGRILSSLSMHASHPHSIPNNIRVQIHHGFNQKCSFLSIGPASEILGIMRPVRESALATDNLQDE